MRVNNTAHVNAPCMHACRSLCTQGVIFTWTPDGRPTGEAFVELKDEEAQREAMKRHKELMGNRYIELFTSTKADLIQAIQVCVHALVLAAAAGGCRFRLALNAGRCQREALSMCLGWGRSGRAAGQGKGSMPRQRLAALSMNW